LAACNIQASQKIMKIALIGYGKMGREIEKIALQRGHEISLKISSTNFFDIDFIANSDVAIEFTRPEIAIENIKKCFKHNVPVVVGTTGWYNELERVKKDCQEKNQTLLYASNFSVGVNIFFEINKQLAKLMNNQSMYEVSMEEIHHTQKLDAPSGTAITLAEGVLENIDRKDHWINEQSSDSKELSIISKRIDSVPGTHIVKYFSEIDQIEISHTAHNRQGFAMGAVLAAEFIYGKKGIYGMSDVLNIK
jgi:4-hydroxy-tetrahydrodipicolinate reductase